VANIGPPGDILGMSSELKKKLSSQGKIFFLKKNELKKLNPALKKKETQRIMSFVTLQINAKPCVSYLEAAVRQMQLGYDSPY
jgi:hypothetical protein